MSQALFFCSELSRSAAEMTFGTASVGEVWLLVEYPYAWGPRAFDDSLLPGHVKAHLDRFLQATPRARLLFIKQGRQRLPGVRLYLVSTRERDPFVVRFQLDIYERLLEIDFAAALAGRGAACAVAVTREPLYLVCTHGRRDKCCAKFGYPLYKSLREDVGEAVWQSSHVGGDRFAANLVCFPHGLFYAHATEASARSIIEAYGAGRLLLDKYRGRACYPNYIQAAEFFIRRESGLVGLDELRYAGRRRLGETDWVVRFAREGEGELHEARVASRVSEFQNYITCHAAAPTSVPQYVLEDYRVTTRLVETPG